MRSLRRRAIMGGSLWAGLIVLIGGYALISYFAATSQARFDKDLLEEHLQVVVALNNSGGDPDFINSFISKPSYTRPYSGSYWQIFGPDGLELASRSLFDTTLPAPVSANASRQFWQGEGPNGPLRGVHQIVTLEDESEWVVSVGESLSALYVEQQSIRQSLLTTLGLIGVLGVAAAVLLTSAIVQPLSRLRQDVNSRWEKGGLLEPSAYPDEVAPLVSDISALLARNRETVDRARRQAADMAHALKTPSTILRNELDLLEMSGTNVKEAKEALSRIDAQLLRSLARMRASNAGAGLAETTQIAETVNRLLRLFKNYASDKGGSIKASVPAGLLVPMDQQDLEETLGNLLENAFKYGASNVLISGRASQASIEILIEDDGPGIPQSQRDYVMAPGARLDTAKPGTGLGLAIAQDLVRAYGGQLSLGTSQQLGGLRIIISVPNLGQAGITAQPATSAKRLGPKHSPEYRA